MSDRTTYILEFSVLTFISLLILIGLTLWIIRILHSRTQNSAVTKGDLDRVVESVENMRGQNSAEHGSLEHFMRALHANFSIFMERFGFLKPKAPAPKAKGVDEDPL